MVGQIKRTGSTLGEILGYLVRTSSLQRLMIHESSNRIGNQPRTHTRSPGATFMSSLVYSLSVCAQTYTHTTGTTLNLLDYGIISEEGTGDMQLGTSGPCFY